MTARRRSAAPLALAALLLAACGTGEAAYRLRRLAQDPAGGGDAAISPDGRRLVITSRRAGQWDLWMFDLGDGRWSRLTDDPGDDFEARFSPDGERLVFTSTRSGQKDLWVMRLDGGGEPLRLTTSEHEDEYPVWSPDGESVVYTGGPWGGRDYFLVAAGGGAPRRLSRESGRAGACAFEPAGESLICHRYDLGTGDIVRLWLDGEMAPLTVGRPWDYKPTTSPDSRWTAFSRAEEGPSHICVMPAQGGRVRRLTDSPHDDRWPIWTAAGHTLLFHRLVDRGVGVHLLDRASGTRRTVVGAAEAPLQAALDPRGERVVFCAQEANRKVLKVVGLDGGPPRRLDTGPGEACYPRFFPDGERIAFAAKPADRWEIAVVPAGGGEPRLLTADYPELRGMDGPLDVSPDGGRILFHADTAPFEADLFLVDVASGRLTALTRDPWFDEAPAFSPDGGHAVFMSTRGGDWTWGLFRLPLAGGAAETLAGPDWVEKNYPRPGPAGHTVWSGKDEQEREILLERAPSGEVERIAAAGEGARWPSYSADGARILFTAVEHHVEYWLAEEVFGAGSPLSGESGWTAARPAAARPAVLEPAAARALARSPVDLHRR